MKTHLMHRNRDFVLNPQAAANGRELVQDLELGTLFRSMSRGDEFLLQAATSALLNSLPDTAEILYRQNVLRDCIAHGSVVRDMYGIAVDACEQYRKAWGWLFTKYPEGVVHRSRELLYMFLSSLQRLKLLAAQHEASFHSEGFRQLFSMLRRELDDCFVECVEQHLRVLAFPHGILMSSELGEGNRGAEYILQRIPLFRETRFARMKRRWRGLRVHDRDSFAYEVDGRDEAGFMALSNLKNRAIAPVAIALAQSTDHILTFFGLLRLELAFFIGCLNLYESVIRKGEPIAFPTPLPEPAAALRARGLYDICLSLSSPEGMVGNDIQSEGSFLSVITGANRGGKSTFLRSIGLSQMMMQCGMFVAAKSYAGSLCRGVFTHFKRQEDPNMEKGKLDEELSRLSDIVDRVGPYSLILMNESLASTNEREGSAIARQILAGFRDMRVRVYYVTHIYELAEELSRTDPEDVLFLRAERSLDGRRSFRIIPGEPLPTSYGLDLYHEILKNSPT